MRLAHPCHRKKRIVWDTRAALRDPYETPSLRRRAITALVFLFGFYAFTIGISLVLFAVPAVWYFAMRNASANLMVWIIFICWLSAFGLLQGIFSTKRPRFVSKGRKLSRVDAAPLFDLLDELASKAGIASPAEVHLVPTMDVAVTEVGGFFGYKSTRILIVGLPVLELLTIQEARAVLAHELGHFVGGDTRLSGVLAYTVEMFRSVKQTVRRKRIGSGMFGFAREFREHLGHLIVDAYAAVFFRVMSASSRQQEIAADVLATRLAGRDAAKSALEKITLADPLYPVYLLTNVRLAIDSDVMPSDLMDGFQIFREQFSKRDEFQKLQAEVRSAKTVAHDTHPALAERLAVIDAQAVDIANDDPRLAVTLLSESREELDRWLGTETLQIFKSEKPLRALPWIEIGEQAYGPRLLKKGQAVADRLRGLFPPIEDVTQMFVRIVSDLHARGPEPLAFFLAPVIERVHPSQRNDLVLDFAGEALAALFQAALLNCGGKAETSLGEVSVAITWNGRRIHAADLARRALRENEARAEVDSFVEELASARAPS